METIINATEGIFSKYRSKKDAELPQPVTWKQLLLIGGNF